MARVDNLEFLSDIVPRTITYKQVKEKKAPNAPGVSNGEGSVETGQTTLDVRTTVLNGANGFGHGGAGDDTDDAGTADPNAQLEKEMRGTRADPTSVNGEEESHDVEMSGNGV